MMMFESLIRQSFASAAHKFHAEFSFDVASRTIRKLINFPFMIRRLKTNYRSKNIIAGGVTSIAIGCRHSIN